MAYKGQTFRIPCDKGGFNYSKNIDLIAFEMMIDGSKNIEIGEGAKDKRGGTAHVNTDAITDTPDIMGIHDFTMQNTTQYIVFATSDGKVYQDATTTIATGWNSNTYVNFMTMDDKLFAANGSGIPKYWAGTGNMTAFSKMPSEWTGTNYPTQFVKHSKGNQQRLWALGFKDGSCYAALTTDPTDFTAGTVITIQIDTNDAYGIIGGYELGGRLFAVGKRKNYWIDDEDSSTANWGYEECVWNGGAAHCRLIIVTPYDVVLMNEDGDIYSVLAADTYGDYKAASITSKAHIDRWIKEKCDLTQIDKFHGLYDPRTRAIYVWVVRTGQTSPDTCLVYYIDIGPEHGWAIMDNINYPSGYSAYSATIVRAASGNTKIYTGDGSGFIWKLHETNKNDNGNPVDAHYITPHITFDNPREDKFYDRGWIIGVPSGAEPLSVDIYIDGDLKGSTECLLTASDALLDAFMLNEDELGAGGMTNTYFNIKQRGKRIQLDFHMNASGGEFSISQVLIDYKSLGSKM